MNKILIFSLLVAFTTGFRVCGQPGVADNERPGWQKIGDRMVDLEKEKDEITLVGNDRWSSIKFKVTEAPIRLISLELFFDVGVNQVVRLNNTINVAGESRTIDLKGGERNLKKIAFTYKTLPNRADKLASIEVFGLKEVIVRKKPGPQPSAMPVSAEKKEPPATLYGVEGNRNNGSTDSTFKMPATLVSNDNTGWKKIGERTVDFSKGRDDIMVFGTNRFAKIKMRTLDVTLNVTSIDMQFNGGLNQVSQFDRPLEPGKESREVLIEEKVKDHSLEKVTFYYKTFVTPPGDNKARVEIWGFKLPVDQSTIK